MNTTAYRWFNDIHTRFHTLQGKIKNFYNYIVRKVSEVFKDIHPTSRLKKFLFRFICVAGI